MVERNNMRTKADRLQEELGKASLCTPDALLHTSDFGLLRLGSLTHTDIKKITHDAATSLLKPGFMTALEAEKRLRDRSQRLSTGCAHLDSVLGGGFPVQGITEIAGESGSGKTQLCLQLAMSVQYPPSLGGLGAGAVYICTEDTFPSRRLQQLFQTHPSHRLKGFHDVQGKKPEFGDNIFVEHIPDVEGLRQCILGRLPKLLSQQNISLVVIDSIAGVFRTSYDGKEMSIRAQDLRTIGGQLHHLARHYNICVICVNQVSGCINRRFRTLSSQHSTVPTLGLAWANLVTTRIQLHRTENGGVDASPVRYMEMVFAPDLPQQQVQYCINESGVFGTPSS